VPLSIYSTMPKNYKQGELYELRCRKTGRVYVGSRGTTEEERMKWHTDKLSKYLQTKVIVYHSSLVLESNDYVVNTIESYPCECDVDVCTRVECKRRLNHREGEYIRQYREEFGELCVNKVIAGRTQKERRAENLEEYQEENRQYRTKNKERENARSTKWKQDNPDRVKKWWQDNPDKRAEYAEKFKVPDKCKMCGAIIQRISIPRHMRSCFKSSCDSMNLIEI